MANNVLGIIFSNAYDDFIPELTALRTMGSVPYAGRYRLIDFPLSNMVNAGISKVGLITNSNYRSLMDHVGNGKPWDLSRKNEGLFFLPPFNQVTTGMFNGKIDALYGSIDFIADSTKEYVLFSDCNFISTIDYNDFLKFNADNDADITVAVANGMPPEIEGATGYEIENGRVKNIELISDYSKPANYSIKVMVMKRTLLERLLREAKARRISHFEDLLALNVNNLKICAYSVEGYVKVICSLKSYYEANLELLRPEIRKSVFNGEKPVYTKTGDRIPSIYGIAAKAGNSLIADGCKIEGEVENSILFRGVTVAKGAKVKNSIIMQDTIIGEGSSLECVICDKDVVIKPNKKLCGADNYPVFVGKGTVI